jgi:hypothetical protein
LYARARGDVFGGVGHDDGATGKVGDDALVGLRARPAADEHDVAIGADARGHECVEAVEQPAHDAFDGGTREIDPRCRRAEPADVAGGIGTIGCAFAVEVRDHDHATGAGAGLQGERV